MRAKLSFISVTHGQHETHSLSSISKWFVLPILFEEERIIVESGGSLLNPENCNKKRIRNKSIFQTTDLSIANGAGIEV